jgi:hypothetical protein
VLLISLGNKRIGAKSLTMIILLLLLQVPRSRFVLLFGCLLWLYTSIVVRLRIPSMFWVDIMRLFSLYCCLPSTKPIMRATASPKSSIQKSYVNAKPVRRTKRFLDRFVEILCCFCLLLRIATSADDEDIPTFD